mgnify:CR=1 FL=1
MVSHTHHYATVATHLASRGLRIPEEVAVLGYELWRSRFGGDPGVVGREVRLGNVPHTVVGVMPEGFEFPSNHSYWIPWRVDAAAYEPVVELIKFIDQLRKQKS